MTSDLFKNTSEIKNLSREYQISTGQVQTLQRQAREAGRSFEEFTQQLRDTGVELNTIAEAKEFVTFTETDIENVERFANAWHGLVLETQSFFGRMIGGGTAIYNTLNDPLHEYFRQLNIRLEKARAKGNLDIPGLQKLDTQIADLRFKILPDDQKLVALQERLKGFQETQRSAMASSEPKDVKTFKEAERDELKTQIEIERLQTTINRKDATGSTTPPAINSLQQIGAFVGFSPLLQEQKTLNQRVGQAVNALNSIDAKTPREGSNGIF